MGVSTVRTLAVRLCALGLVCMSGSSCGDAVTDGDGVRGSGQIAVDRRTVAGFERLVLAGEGRVEFGAGSDGYVEVETDENLLTSIRTVVADDTLTISTEPDVDIEPSSGVTYRIGCPIVTAVALTGAGSVDLATCTTAGDLEIDLSGAGSIAARAVEVSTLRGSLTGAGEIVVAGHAERLEVVVAGVGEFDGRDLEVSRADVESSGVGPATVWVLDELDVSISGVGGVSYYGTPEVNSTITGIGDVEALGTK